MEAMHSDNLETFIDFTEEGQCKHYPFVKSKGHLENGWPVLEKQGLNPPEG
jgi:hypothetical protein